MLPLEPVKYQSCTTDEQVCLTDMSVAQDIALDAQFELLQALVATVHNVNIHKDARPTDPDLPMKASCDFNGFQFSRFCIRQLIVGSQWAW